MRYWRNAVRTLYWANNSSKAAQNESVATVVSAVGICSVAVVTARSLLWWVG